jgi:methyltransferase
MLSELLFFGFVTLVVAQRLAELWLSRRHEVELQRHGAREHAARQMLAMQLLHGLWFASMLLEVGLLAPPVLPWLSALSGLVFFAGQALRYSAMHALGWRWSVRIYTVPGAAPVASGIYRYVRHPNYLGVVLEMAALPLLHSAWRTALLFSTANAVLLALRIRAEERALSENGGYDQLALRPRLWPSLRPRGTS